MVQDWVYWDRHSLELTLELNPIMKPPVEEVGGIMWQQNLPALMRFMELVRPAGCCIRCFSHRRVHVAHTGYTLPCLAVDGVFGQWCEHHMCSMHKMTGSLSITQMVRM